MLKIHHQSLKKYQRKKKLQSSNNNVFIGHLANRVADSANNNIVIAIAEKDNQTVIGNDSTEETKVYGDLIVTGTDKVKRQIIFSSYGSCRWTTVS